MSTELETDTIQHNLSQLQNSVVTATIYVTDHKTVGANHKDGENSGKT
jgi:hypothetical protein